MQAIIRCHNLSKIKSPYVLLPSVNFSIDHGEMVAIMGSSGCGKSTLLNILGLIDSPSDGEYFFNGTDTTTLSLTRKAQIRRDAISYIFQQYHLIDHMHVFDNIMLPLSYKKAITSSKTVFEQLVDQLGLSSLINKYPHELSGGQQQRVSIARALITQPKLLLADEPTGALDNQTSMSILAALRSVHQQFDTTIILVTHDKAVANACDRTLQFSQLQAKIV